MSFEKIATLYVFCADYHSGQRSRLYRILSRIDRIYQPFLHDWNEWRETELYRELAHKYHGDKK